MALWGISTQSENWANSYAIPKFLNDQDRNNTPHNCFADDRGWIYRRYQSDDHSGLGTIYTDEVLIPVLCWSTSLWPLIQAGLKIKFVDIGAIW